MTVADINAYGLVIGGSLVIILSYFANLLAKRTNIPSVPVSYTHLTLPTIYSV